MLVLMLIASQVTAYVLAFADGLFERSQDLVTLIWVAFYAFLNGFLWFFASVIPAFILCSFIAIPLSKRYKHGINPHSLWTMSLLSTFGVVICFGFQAFVIYKTISS